MDDARWFLHRNSDELEQVSRRVGTYDEESFLALVLELGKLDGVLPCVTDRTVTDPLLAGRVRNLYIVKGTLTMGRVKGRLTLAPWLRVRMRPDPDLSGRARRRRLTRDGPGWLSG